MVFLPRTYVLHSFAIVRSGNPTQVGGAVAVRQRNLYPREPGSPEKAECPQSGEEQHLRQEERHLVSNNRRISIVPAVN